MAVCADRHSLMWRRGMHAVISGPSNPLGVFSPDLFDGRSVLVTGGGRGIGRAIAMGFARLGATVVIASRSADALKATAADVEAIGSKCFAVKTDIRDVSSVANLLKEVEGMGGVDFLVNNAGGQFPAKPSGISDNGWRSVVDLNLNGTWNMCSRFSPHLMDRGYGSIVNLVHTFVFDRGAPLMAHSGAARAGVVNLTRTLSPYLVQKNVTINALAFAFTESTGLDLELNALEKDEAWISSGLEAMGVGRTSSADEIAAIVAFLCSSAAMYVSGTVVVADRGSMQMNWPFSDGSTFQDF
jgi:NAD(P)-dependent dehydrogenase (short-subunit alcohol dehydrogenase family)